MGCEDLDWIHVAQDREHYMVMDLVVPQKARNFLTS